MTAKAKRSPEDDDDDDGGDGETGGGGKTATPGAKPKKQQTCPSCNGTGKMLTPVHRPCLTCQECGGRRTIDS
jgi:hypothetical protein